MISCGNSTDATDEVTADQNAKSKWSIELEELFDDSYPNNPDISIRHSRYTEIEYEK